MISTTGTGLSERGSSRVPYSLPFSVSTLMGRCTTLGAAALAVPAIRLSSSTGISVTGRASRRSAFGTRSRELPDNIARPSWGESRLDARGDRRFEDELNREPAYTGALGLTIWFFG